MTGVFVLNEKDELLIVTGPKFPDWVIPGGHVEPGEKITECCKRELFEEVGLDCSAFRFICVNEDTQRLIRGEQRHLVYLNYACRISKPQVELEELELSEFDWVPLDKCTQDKRISNGIRTEVLPELQKLAIEQWGLND